MVQESYELRTKLEAKEKAILVQESDFEEYQKQTFKKHEEEIQEIQENMRRELKSSKKDKDAANTDLEQVSIIYLFPLLLLFLFSFITLLHEYYVINRNGKFSC